MISNNMNYRYNVEYYDGLELQGEGFSVQGDMTGRTQEIVKFSFPANNSLLEKLENIDGIKMFSLYTAYPGLMIGTGAMHDIGMKEALKNGFTFDYVTGLPYLPGSSLKGMLRSYFPEGKDATEKMKYIQSYLPNIDIGAFMDWAFGNDKPGNINFIGAFPVISGSANNLLSLEYITPHPNKFKNPIPISMLKIKPGIKFQFVFLCRDYKGGNGEISSDEIMNLFKHIVLDMGIGAKTNVGFGVMVERAPTQNIMFECSENGNSSHNNTNYRTNRNNRGTYPMDGVINCKVCKKNYQTMFKGQPVTSCPYCEKKKAKK